jgi:hypothetical protein
MPEPTTLTTPVRPEHCCATCRWWVAQAGSAWCPTIAAALPTPLTEVACAAYAQERYETLAVEHYERLCQGEH